MMDSFCKAGYVVVPFTEWADVYVVNTCTVTSIGDKKSRQVIRRAKLKNPNSILCAVGCYVQVASDEVKALKEIDILLGTMEKREIVKIVEEYQKRYENSSKKEQIVEVGNIMKLQPYEEYDGIAYTKHTRAEVKIQDGCDRFCSYCRIPYARGPVRSRKKEAIIEEIEQLVKAGAKEIVLTGIHISSYGKDFREEEALISLLEQLDSLDGLERIRLGSLEPRIITKDFVLRLAKLHKICNHFHLSLQSGCDETLQRMNRKYKTEDFRQIVRLLRENIPEVALTTDVIVGFPGETEEEFQKTVLFLKEIKFSKMHIFPYSKREGTPAATYPDQVENSVKEQRSEVLIAMSAENEKEFAMAYIGKPVEVLFENETEGHTTNYIKVIREKGNKAKEKATEIVFPTSWEDGALRV